MPKTSQTRPKTVPKTKPKAKVSVKATKPTLKKGSAKVVSPKTKPVAAKRAKPRNPNKPAPGFKPSEWWGRSSEYSKKKYIEKHPLGDYAKMFAKKFKIKYDAKKGIDMSTVRKLKVKGEKTLKVDLSKPEVPSAAPSEKAAKPVGKPEPKAPEKSPDGTEPKEQRSIEQVRKHNILKSAGHKLKAYKRLIVHKLRKKFGTKAKHAESALKDLSEDKPENVTPEKKAALVKVSSSMGKMALLALGAVALFTPLAPVAASIGLTYMEEKYPNLFKEKDKEEDEDDDEEEGHEQEQPESHEQEQPEEDDVGHEQEQPKKTDKTKPDAKEKSSTSATDMPTSLEDLYSSMSSWLLQQDPSELAARIKADKGGV